MTKRNASFLELLMKYFINSDSKLGKNNSIYKFDDITEFDGYINNI